MRTLILSIALATLSPALLNAQDDPPEPETPITPEQAVEMLKEVHGLMEKAEESLNDSSRGEALATEEEVMKKIDALLKEEGPEAAQKSILEKIEKLLKRSEKKQGKSIDLINELLRRLPKSQGDGQGSKEGQQPQPGEPKEGTKKNPSNSSQNPGNAAQQPYNPNRDDPANKFRSHNDRFGIWGILPPRIREALNHDARALDDFPAEYQEIIKQYHKVISEEETKRP